MSEPFLAEVKIVAFNFAPRGWAFCDGQILPINQNQSLYALLGTTFGGDGRTSFGLPDLRGRAPLHPDVSGPTGRQAGTETNSLTVAEVPSQTHSHAVMASSATQNAATPATNLLATTGGRRPVVPYGDGSSNITAMTATENTGGQPVNNMQPFLTLNFCISLQGLFPSRN